MDAHPRRQTHRTRRPNRGRLLLLLGALAVVVVNGFPFYWMLLTSVKPGTELFTDPPAFWTTRPDLDGYVRLLETTNFLTYFRNSVVVACGATLASVTVSTLAAYGLTRFTFFGSRTFTTTILYAYTFAPIVIVVPLYGIFREAGLINSHLGLILAYASFGVPFSLWLLRPFFSAIPLELEEAALVDGANRPRAAWHVVVPMAVPGVIAVSVFTFLLAWEDFIFAKVLITRDELKTLPVALHDTYNASLQDWPMLMAGAVLVTAPVLVGFFVVQRHLVAGWGAGGVK